MRLPRLVPLLALTGLFLPSCATRLVVSNAPAGADTALKRLLTPQEKLLNHARIITLEWNCDQTIGVDTGIESTTNLAGPWSLECRFPAQTFNLWTDTNQPGQMKLYRAFNVWATN